MREIRGLTVNKLKSIMSQDSFSPSTTTATDPAKSPSPLASAAPSVKPLGPNYSRASTLMPSDKLVPLSDNSASSSSSPLAFFVHPVEGDVSSLRPLGASLPFPAFGLQCTRQVDTATISSMADSYVDSVLEMLKQGADVGAGGDAPPRRPFVIGGYSYGAAVAIEMCLRLQQVWRIFGTKSWATLVLSLLH